MTNRSAIDRWEDENWTAIEAALADAEASFQRGNYAEFRLEDFLIESPHTTVPTRQS